MLGSGFGLGGLTASRGVWKKALITCLKMFEVNFLNDLSDKEPVKRHYLEVCIRHVRASCQRGVRQKTDAKIKRLLSEDHELNK